jgi:hypothetical protein
VVSEFCIEIALCEFLNITHREATFSTAHPYGSIAGVCSNSRRSRRNACIARHSINRGRPDDFSREPINFVGIARQLHPCAELCRRR